MSTVNDFGERFQVLQHAFVYDFPAVVLAISDNQSELIRSLVIDYTSELKESFGEVLKDLKETSLDWAYPVLTQRQQVVTIPDEIFAIADSIPTINGHETLQGTANLWLAMCKLPKPFPSFLRLIPAIYAFWNAVKGGSDTLTKLMDDCILRVPKCHLNPETAAITRMIMLILTLCHCLFQVISTNSHLNYPSLHHYRAAASAWTTFHVSLLQCNQIFKAELVAVTTSVTTEGNPISAANPLMSPSSSTCNNQSTIRRRNPKRQRIDGALPEPTTFGATLPMNTPKKWDQW